IDVHTLARALDGDAVGRNTVVAPGPGHSRRDRSLSVRLTDGDFVVFSHAGDDWPRAWRRAWRRANSATRRRGRLTGINAFAAELGAKELALLHELVPSNSDRRLSRESERGHRMRRRDFITLRGGAAV